VKVASAVRLRRKMRRREAGKSCPEVCIHIYFQMSGDRIKLDRFLNSGRLSRDLPQRDFRLTELGEATLSRGVLGS
jgi:hypothetical protein